MISKMDKNADRRIRHARVRKKIYGTCIKPRFNVYRSTKYVYVQLIDDVNGNTLVSANSLQMAGELKGKNKCEQAKAVGEANAKAGRDFLDANGKREEVKTTPSGLQYEVLKEGDGPMPAATDSVKVHYTGRLLDGTVFDSSVSRGEPATFPLNRVIPGWTEGLQLMKEGAKYTFFIPSDLAYGPQGAGQIPPHSTLIFDVELIKVG